MPRIGQLSERVTLQVATETADAAGGFATTWADVVTVWARVKPMGGDEIFKANELQGLTGYTVTLRYYGTLTQKHRLMWRGAQLNIRSVINTDEKRRFMDLLCDTGRGT